MYFLRELFKFLLSAAEEGELMTVLLAVVVEVWCSIITTALLLAQSTPSLLEVADLDQRASARAGMDHRHRLLALLRLEGAGHEPTALVVRRPLSSGVVTADRVQGPVVEVVGPGVMAPAAFYTMVETVAAEYRSKWVTLCCTLVEGVVEPVVSIRAVEAALHLALVDPAAAAVEARQTGPMVRQDLPTRVVEAVEAQTSHRATEEMAARASLLSGGLLSRWWAPRQLPRLSTPIASV